MKAEDKETDPLACRQKDCDGPAAFRYTWPGHDESYCCVIHAMKLQQVAAAIGLHLQCIPLTPADYSRMMEDPNHARP